MEHLEQLQLLGLSDKQARVYLTLVEMGRGSAQAIAHKASIKRSTTYALLEELISLGLVVLIPNSVKKYYRPLSPELLIEKHERKVRKVKQIVPEIEALLREKGMNEKPHVVFHEGVEGIKKIVSYRLEELEGDELREMLVSAKKETLALFGNFFEKYAKKLKALNIKERGISPDTEEVAEYNEQYKKEGTNIKIVSPEIWRSSVAIEIGKTWVKMYDLANLQGIVIQNEAIAHAMKQMFELSWKGVEHS